MSNAYAFGIIHILANYYPCQLNGLKLFDTFDIYDPLIEKNAPSKNNILIFTSYRLLQIVVR